MNKWLFRVKKKHVLQHIRVACGGASLKRVAGKNWYPVRGLQRFNKTYCCKFYDRDANAALNIWAVHHMQAALVAGVLHRPSHLSRENDEGLGEPSRFTLSAV